jgi:hypothetical protein
MKGTNRITNPNPYYSFPLWAIGLIVGGVVLFAILVLVLCFCCQRGKKGRRKRRPLTSQALYTPLVDEETVKEPMGGSLSGGSNGTSQVSRSDVEDMEHPYEVLFSVKKSTKPEALLVNRKEIVMIRQSDWDSRTEVVRATSSLGVTGYLPSTHVKLKKKKKGGK